MKYVNVYGIKNDSGERLVFANISEKALLDRGIETARAAGYIALRIAEIWSPYNRTPRETYIAL